MKNIPKAREDQRETILASAYDRFSRYGFRKTTVEEIARGAGLKKPSVYYYFRSKEEIIRELVRREGRKLLARLETAVNVESSIGDKLRAFFITRIAYFKEQKRRGALSIEELDEMRPLLTDAFRQFFEQEIRVLSQVFEQAAAAGEIEIDNPRLCSLVAVAALQGVDDVFWRSGFEDQIEAGMGLMLEIFLKGLSKERS
jgi:AcrR family transcriptional regulator